MALNTFSPNTKIKSAELNANFEGLADGSLIENGSITPAKWTNPYCFGVHLSADQTGLADASATTIQFDTEFFDYNSNFNTTTHTYTVPVDGVYAFWLHLQVAGTSISDLYGQLYINGTTQRVVTRDRVSTENNRTTTGLITVLMSAGDTAVFRAYANVSSGTSTIEGGDVIHATYAGGYLIHPI